MGLDIVEFVMEVEEAFGVAIPDRVAERLATPRHVAEHIHEKLPKNRESRCLSQRAFYVIRRALEHRLGLPRSRFRPGTELLSVLPAQSADRVWAEVGESLHCAPWPHVRGNAWFARLFQGRVNTLGEAAQRFAMLAPRVLKAPGEGWSWNEVVEVIDGLMCRHFAIREYSLDDRFIEDLGLD